ncbi:MAG: hypothetical protein P1U63_08990 [Coxiellaceae bacterium]|nr:hypothetical protein [Coxiellaceae bacterium]
MFYPHHTPAQTDTEKEYQQNMPRLITIALIGLATTLISLPDEINLSLKTAVDLTGTVLGLGMIAFSGLTLKSLKNEATRGRATISHFFTQQPPQQQQQAQAAHQTAGLSPREQ